MSKPEDKTLNSIRVLSNKKASKNLGSIVTHGGVYVDKNIECAEEIITEELVVKGLTKLAGDVSIGGTIYCPDLYTIDDNTFRFKRNLVPDRPKNPLSECDKSSLGTYREPWDIAYAQCIKAGNAEIGSFYAGINTYGNPSFSIRPSQINICDQLNIINPCNNMVMMKTCDGIIEAYAPIYSQWDSFRAIELPYNPEEILYISASTILLDIRNESNLCLTYDAKMVPPNTKIKIYFIKQKQSIKANYKLNLFRANKKYIFTSCIPSKKIKLMFMEEYVYLIN
jgi:hypothetical protein